MGTIAKTCPFCGENLKLDRVGIRSAFIVHCDNDNCDVKPCTNDGAPTEVIAEAEFFGKIIIK